MESIVVDCYLDKEKIVKCNEYELLIDLAESKNEAKKLQSSS